jgi:ATP-binding protein involved in chromosome partitioning
MNGAAPFAARSTPAEITRAGEHDLRVLWRDGHESIYEARALRLACRCANCVEEMSGRPLLDPDAVPADVHPLKLDLLGHYAIQIAWSDGHSTGIYTFEHLRELCDCAACTAERKA